MAKAPVKQSEEIHIEPLKATTTTLRIVGTTPLIQNRLSEKMRHYFLIGGGKKTSAEKVNVKHNPLEEYRNSMELMPESQQSETVCALRTVAVKAAMCDAAIDTPGAKKAQSQRLLYMPGDHTPLYGTPELRLDMVRTADAKATPDIRSRACYNKWGAEVTIRFITPQLSLRSVVTMLANAGMLIGVGDFRQQKGKGSFGCFRVLSADQQDDEWDDLVANHGREAQLAAIQAPSYATEETRELMAFYDQEIKRRRAA